MSFDWCQVVGTPCLTVCFADSYDLKQELSKSPVSKCPNELSRHPAAQSRVTSAMKRQAADLD